MRRHPMVKSRSVERIQSGVAVSSRSGSGNRPDCRSWCRRCLVIPSSPQTSAVPSNSIMVIVSSCAVQSSWTAGRPYSPSMPKKLHRIKQVKHTETYQPNHDDDAECTRRPSRRGRCARSYPTGCGVPVAPRCYMCPAAAGKLRCPLVAASALLALGTMPAANPPVKAGPDTVCSSKFRTFTAEELPLSQRHIFGSTAWRSRAPLRAH